MNPPEDPRGADASQTRSASGPETAIDKLQRLFGGMGGAPAGPPAPVTGGDDGDDEEDGMLRMSFLGHLEELRSRIIKCVFGIAAAVIISYVFVDPLWDFVKKPAKAALLANGFRPELIATTPMEGFNIIWFKLPFVCAIFIASPWILLQIWGFISPGLYRKERRWAVPFVGGSALLFILGGLFGYFVVFKFGLTYLLGIGKGKDFVPLITISEYFDLFVNVILGVGVVFELPVIIFFLIVLHIVTPRFLVRHSRYAILLIFLVAAIVTPTPDIFNMSLVALPMCLLFYVGIFAGYLLVLQRENRKFPWGTVIKITLTVLLLVGGVLYLAITRYGYKLVPHWPFLTR